jgi:hypothetical protein
MTRYDPFGWIWLQEHEIEMRVSAVLVPCDLRLHPPSLSCHPQHVATTTPIAGQGISLTNPFTCRLLSALVALSHAP